MESGADTLGDAVTALYRLLPDEFTVARSALAEKVRAEGNDLLAARIRKIPKPTLPAYWVNRVAAQWPVELASLLAVGAELRQATQQRDRERLTSLDRQRRIQTDALLSLLWQFGENEAKAGRKKPSQATLTRVSETLTAAVMDIEVAPLVGSGAVARPFLHEGFGLLDVPEDDRSETTAPVTSLHAKRALTSVPPSHRGVGGRFAAGDERAGWRWPGRARHGSVGRRRESTDSRARPLRSAACRTWLNRR